MVTKALPGRIAGPMLVLLLTRETVLRASSATFVVFLPYWLYILLTIHARALTLSVTCPALDTIQQPRHYRRNHRHDPFRLCWMRHGRVVAVHFGVE